MRYAFQLSALLCLFAIQTTLAQLPNIDSLINIINQPKQDTGQVIAYRMLAGITLNSNTSKAVSYAKAGAALGEKLHFDKGVAGCLLNAAVAYATGGKLDSGLLYIDTAITWSKKVGEPARIALAYLNKADFNRQLGNMKQALIDADTSMFYAIQADKNDTRARIYQTIGSVYHAQDNFSQSKFYYEKAYEMYEKGNNKRMMAISISNLGNVYRRLTKYDSAVASFQTAVKLSESINDLNNLAIYYTNISEVYIDTKNFKQAEGAASKALGYGRQQENDIQIANAQLKLANIYTANTNWAAAINAGLEAYNLFNRTGLTEERQQAAEVLSEAYNKSGNYKEAYQYLQISKVLADSVSRAKFDGDVATMQTNFKVNEKDREIELLAKDKELQSQKINQQRLVMFGVAALALLSMVGIWLVINRNRLQQRMKELELRNQIAADLHDEVGSSLSSIHMLSQMAIEQGKEATHKDILTRMSNNAKETMDKMGDIVWMIKPGETEAGSLRQRMERFAYDISSSKGIDLVMKLEDLEKIKLSMEQRKNIYLIFKEAVNNAMKYAATEKIEVNAMLQAKNFLLEVKDFGKGFNSGNIKKGNGLDNMRNRANELGGVIDIVSTPGGGTSVRLSIPA